MIKNDNSNRQPGEKVKGGVMIKTSIEKKVNCGKIEIIMEVSHRRSVHLMFTMMHYKIDNNIFT